MGTATGAEGVEKNRGEDEGLLPRRAAAAAFAALPPVIRGVVEGDSLLGWGKGRDTWWGLGLAGVGIWFGPKDEGRSGRHLTVTRPVGSDRNHSDRCRIRSVWRWWTAFDSATTGVVTVLCRMRLVCLMGEGAMGS